MAIDFAGGGVSIELSHFVRISDATDLFGFLFVVFFATVYIAGAEAVCDGLGARLRLCFCAYCITATECDFSFVADVVGTGAGSSGTLLRRPLRCTVYGRSRPEFL